MAVSARGIPRTTGVELIEEEFMKAVIDPVMLVNELYSRDIVSDNVLAKILSNPGSSSSSTVILFQAIKAKLHESPESMTTILSVLEKSFAVVPDYVPHLRDYRKPSSITSATDTLKQASSQSTQSRATIDPAKGFKRMFPELVEAVVDPARLARELFSADLISVRMLDRMSATFVKGSRKTSALLMSLQATLETNPFCFEKVLMVFETSPAVLPGTASQLRQACFHGQPPPTTAATGSSQVPPSYRHYNKYLKAMYSRSHDNKWPSNLLNSYINLASVLKPHISRDKADAFTRATLHHGIDEILAYKQPIAMEDVLKPLKGQKNVRCVLVEGPPGVGKSTFAWELCQRWDDIPDLKKFPLVVLLRCRDKHVQEAKKIADLLYHPDASIRQAVVKEVCSRTGEGLLLIVDGFDEFPASLRECSLLLDIIKGTHSPIPGCTVVVTSRPSATADLHRLSNKRIEILGFTQKEIEEYASKYFDSDPELLEGFLQYRKLNPAIRSMMYIPFNTTIVAEVFLSSGGKPLSHTMTELYEEMAISILIRFLREKGLDEIADQLPSKLADLPADILANFKKLGEMAFKGILNEEVIFNKFPTECEHYGFLNASSELYAGTPAMSYHFPHKSFQELFTAFFFSQLPPSEQKEIFKEYSAMFKVMNNKIAGDIRFKEVWRFMAGLTGFKAIGWKEVKSTSSLRELVSYLYEAQDVAACDAILGEVYDIFIAESLFDCYAAGWTIAVSDCRLELTFRSMGSGAEVCEAFISGVKSQKEVRGAVAKLHLAHTPITEEDVVHLMELPSSIWHKTSKLDVVGCGLDASAMGKVADFVRIHMVNLQYLDIYDNHVGEGGLVKLFYILSQHECLQRLNMGANLIGCADVEALAPLIRPDSGRLRELRFTSMQEKPPKWQKMLVDTLLRPSSLESLTMHGVDVSAACDSFALLADNSNLTSIEVDNIGQALPSMLEALKNNKSVQTLTIVPLPHAAAGAVASMLTANKHLETDGLASPW